MKNEALRFADSDIFEGMVSFRAVIDGIGNQTTNRKIKRVIYDTKKASKLSGHLSYIKAMSYKHGFILEPAKDGEIESVAVGTSHGGIITYCTPRTLPALSADIIANNGFYIMLEGVEDPYNFGYALRSVYASGADGVILPEHNWMTAAGVVCRASAGASELMPLYTADAENTVKFFKSKNYRIVSADIKKSVSVYDTDLKRPILLAVGGEKRGLSKTLLENSDFVIRLDYGRNFTAALSAASAASILAFEVFRQNR